MTDFENVKLEEVIAGITQAWPDSVSRGKELSERVAAFVAGDGGGIIDGFLYEVLGSTMVLLRDGEAVGVDAELLHQIVAFQLMLAAAITVRRLKRKSGEEFSPARFALVAYNAGTVAAELPDTEAEAATAVST